ncbi:glycosyl transferase [Mycolicibacterium chubuense]|uniref:4'-demethylrebeccamycin synthase n=1 Tax=Mycolicibacterium chubuense TaxID=1800 RepID=A0A0J6YXI2_MYCCU|nr:glycosyltransferase [Mycolicibacterium chubuense]KMO77156.1 4'-demethylrebeccamycin synthase [Mycolicibacterium chubuense]ORA50920.1 glycosyl transferase [Mycolicibacterium chubuense]SPY00270.1 glycosyl transferase family protein [Mycolicibacterium chubuense]
MASIIIGSVPVHGHVTPLLAVAAHLVARGDDVRFVTGSRFADKVAATGARFVPLPPEADYDDRDLTRSFPQRARLKGARAIAFDIEHVFARPAREQYGALVAALAERPADAVLVEPAFVGAAFLLHRPRPERPAVVVCGVLPLCVESRDTAPFGMGLAPARILNRPRNAVLAGVNRRVLRRPYAVIDALHRDLHGVDMPGTMIDWGRRADALVQFTVPGFEYPRSDAPEALHFAGPLSATGSQAPLPQWWSELDGSRPVVHVTQGTLANLDYEQLIAPTLRALADEDVLVAVTTGGRPLDTLPDLPANARAAIYLPYDELLPRTSVFVTNGGYGGVQYALRFGVPIVATGGKEDKPEVGARVAWSGVGRRIRSEHPSARVLRREILAVLHDGRYRQASARLAAQMAAAPGFTGLADVIDGLTERKTRTCANP